ncbi:hypothetical protein HID58_018788 [Brassica napus]|uniref:Uncharacterized protein n=1 Tax=Brassica napus TaxID=3708 RepID=A0ABQ8DAW4_BRANA|nr:hypothetical protein HID58_018788 [Brassica napus]
MLLSLLHVCGLLGSDTGVRLARERRGEAPLPFTLVFVLLTSDFFVSLSICCGSWVGFSTDIFTAPVVGVLGNVYATIGFSLRLRRRWPRGSAILCGGSGGGIILQWCLALGLTGVDVVQRIQRSGSQAGMVLGFYQGSCVALIVVYGRLVGFLSIYVILFSPPTATFQVHMLWRHTCLVVSAKLACFLAVRFGDSSTGCLLGLGLGFKRFEVLCTCPDLVAVARPLALLWRQHGKSRHPRQQGEPHILVVFIKGREQ